jgi:hypothetical protein
MTAARSVQALSGNVEAQLPSIGSVCGASVVVVTVNVLA